MRPGWTYFGSFKHVIPDRRSAKVNVEVCVAAFYTHETIPAAGNTEGTEKDVEKAKKDPKGQQQKRPTQALQLRKLFIIRHISLWKAIAK